MLIERGGKDKERLYLHNLDFCLNGDTIEVNVTDLPDMKNLVARHIGRYLLPAFFIRPGMKVLDFPCGSGYGSEILTGCGDIEYIGMDNDVPTMEYCRRENLGTFFHFDLRCPTLKDECYDIIACIEGLEHIDSEYQTPLIEAFQKALKANGILVVSTPEAELSGPNPDNPYHLHELTYDDFSSILRKQPFETVQILSHKEQNTTWMYGICKKGER